MATSQDSQGLVHLADDLREPLQAAAGHLGGGPAGEADLGELCPDGRPVGIALKYVAIAPPCRVVLLAVELDDAVTQRADPTVGPAAAVVVADGEEGPADRRARPLLCGLRLGDS
jgi:hypothetical protein